MTPTPLQRAEWVANRCGALAGIYPYVYGGGHGEGPDFNHWTVSFASSTFEGFPPTKGLDPEGTNPKGYDCSAWVDDKLWHGGVYEEGSITQNREAESTEGLAGYGLPGRGQYITVWVRNSGGVHHCFLEITLPGQPVRWSAGAHTGTICGWQPWSQTYDPTTEGYAPRHPEGL